MCQEGSNGHGLFAPSAKWDNTTAIAEEQEDSPFLERQSVNHVQRNQQKELKQRIGATSAPSEDDMAITTPIPDTCTLRSLSKLQQLDFGHL